MRKKKLTEKEIKAFQAFDKAIPFLSDLTIPDLIGFKKRIDGEIINRLIDYKESYLTHKSAAIEFNKQVTELKEKHGL